MRTDKIIYDDTPGNQFRLDPIRLNGIKSDQMASDDNRWSQIISDKSWNKQMPSDGDIKDPMGFDGISLYQIRWDQIRSDNTSSDQMSSNEIVWEKII